MAVQVCGAHGTQETSPFGRYFRDARAVQTTSSSRVEQRHAPGEHPVDMYALGGVRYCARREIVDREPPVQRPRLGAAQNDAIMLQRTDRRRQA